jgi:hypothetical protein
VDIGPKIDRIFTSFSRCSITCCGLTSFLLSFHTKFTPNVSKCLFIGFLGNHFYLDLPQDTSNTSKRLEIGLGKSESWMAISPRRIKTTYPRVYYREAKRIGGRGIEKVHYVVFKKDGKTLEEKRAASKLMT